MGSFVLFLFVSFFLSSGGRCGLKWLGCNLQPVNEVACNEWVLNGGCMMSAAGFE